MTERSTGLPSPRQVIELLDGEFERAGYEIEDVRLDAATRPARIAVVVDGDKPLDLDAIAELSRIASQLLDNLPEPDPYLLEVSSPGVDRPLSTEKHFRRAQGRKVDVVLADGEQVTGRIAGVFTQDGAGRVLRLVVTGGVKGASKFSVRDVALGEVSKAVVQVDFSPPSQRELEIVSSAAEDAGAAGTEAGA